MEFKNNKYQPKYVKYKYKYLKLKNKKKYMLGGVLEIKMEEWNKQSDKGQQNCGIFLSEKYPNYIMKCNTGKRNLEKIYLVNTINSKKHLFPRIIINNSIGDNNYTVMERMDGDLTDLLFKVFPNMVLTKMIEEKEISEEIAKLIVHILNLKISNKYNINLFNIRLILDGNIKNKEEYFHFLYHIRSLPVEKRNDEYTFTLCKDIIKYITDVSIADVCEDKYHDLLHKQYIYKHVNDIYAQYKDALFIINLILQENVDIDIFDKFITKLFLLFDEYLKLIVKEILKINLELIKIGYTHSDNKFDNYGFKLVSLEHINDDNFERGEHPIIDGKKLLVYFLDWDSGLSLIGEEQNIYDKDYREILRTEYAKVYQKGFDNIASKINQKFNFNLMGQYTLYGVIKNIININPILNDVFLDLLIKYGDKNGITREKILNNFQLLQKKYEYKIKIDDLNINDLNPKEMMKVVETYIGYIPGSTQEILEKENYKFSIDDHDVEIIILK